MRSDRERQERVSRITGILNAHHAALVDETVELLANELEWVGPGVWTVEQFLQWRAGVSSSTASQLSAIARRVEDLPSCLTSFRRGELTLDQMAAIARRAPGWVDTEISSLAVSLTVNQLRRVLRDYPFPALDADEIDPQPADTGGINSAVESGAETSSTGEPQMGAVVPMVDEFCSAVFGEDGIYRLHLATDYETGAVIDASLRAAHDRLFQDGHESVTMVDAARDVAEASLGTLTDAARSARFKTTVFLDTTATAADVRGWNIPDAIRRHITCDGLLTPVFVDNGVPVSVGRTQRIVPDRTRTLIEHRDGGCCTVPGCTRTIGLDVHHIIHWEHDGDTDTPNLLLICSHHHRRHHRGMLGITGNADLPTGTPGAVEFTDRHGRRLQPSGATPHNPIGPTPPSPKPYHHPLGERLRTNCIHFNTPRPGTAMTEQPSIA